MSGVRGPPPPTTSSMAETIDAKVFEIPKDYKPVPKDEKKN